MNPDSRTESAATGPPNKAAPKRSGLRFVVVFLGLLGAFYLFSQLGVFVKVIAPGSIRLSALASAPVIRLLGDAVDVRGTMLVSPKGQVEVHYGCDALEPLVYFSAAVIAFPASWRRRLLGIAAGIPVLFVLNIARIVSLYFIATRSPDWFETAHLVIWQPLFIAATLALWFAWVMLLPRSRTLAARPR